MVDPLSPHRVFFAAVSLLTSIVLLRSGRRKKNSVLGLLLADSKVVLIRTAKELRRWISLLRADVCSGEMFQGHYVMGLDSEWKPARNRQIRHRTSVLQLSGPTITLVIQTQLALPDDVVGSSLYNLLQDDSILKVGCGITHDVSKLMRDFKLKTRAYLDIANLSNWIWNRRCGLLKISKECLGIDWGGKKGAGKNTITMSDWSVENLSEDQVLYAASDSFISRKCFFALLADDNYQRHKPEDVSAWFVKHKKLDPPPQKTKLRLAQKKNQAKSSKNGNDAKLRRRQDTLEMRSRQRKLYEYCRLEDIEGNMLAYCNTKKINWYVQRKMGVVVSNSPLTLRLNFNISKGRHFGYSRNKFYLEKKLNICVGCGTEEKLARHHVVPLYYRKHFPEYLRSHCSHDIVLLCIACRMRTKDQELFATISKETGVPVNIPKYVDYPKVVVAKRAARVLSRPDVTDQLPNGRRQELEYICAEFLGKAREELTEQDRETILKNKSRDQVENYVPPGKQIVDMMSPEDLRAFIRRWRQFFLDTMQPKFLSKHWSVNAER